MHGKMRAARKQFSYNVMKILVSEAATKILRIFKKKLMIYYFCVFTIVGILKEGPGANVSDAFLLNMALLESLGHFLRLNTLC